MDYEYKEQFRATLELEPGLERQLSDLIALTSHYDLIKELEPMLKEIERAQNKEEVCAIIEKYQHLFSPNRHHPEVVISFD